MNIEERIASLRQTDLFNAFDDQELQQFAEAVAEIRLEPGQILFQEGDCGQEIFVVVEGELRIFKDKRIITAIRPGNYVGEMAILEDKPRSASVESVTPSLLLKITSAQFQEYLAKQPRSLVSMMTTLSRRVRHDTEMIAADFERANILVHDMKNALSAFLYLDLLKKKSPDLQSIGFIEIMNEARENLATMMSEALSGSRHLYRINNSRPATSLAELINAIVTTEGTLHPDLRDKKITIAHNGKDTPFLFDKLEIRRVLTNLIINAGQASNPGDVIAIGCTQNNEFAEVTIRDQGTGIPPELQERIFTPRFTTKKNGNGFGLTSCKQIIEEHHHGTLTNENNPEGGCTFRFRLPIIDAGRK